MSMLLPRTHGSLSAKALRLLLEQRQPSVLCWRASSGRGTALLRRGLSRAPSAAQAAGPNLTTDSFIKALETVTFPADIFGSPASNWTATKRLGNNDTRMSQITDGRWKVVSGYLNK